MSNVPYHGHEDSAHEAQADDLVTKLYTSGPNNSTKFTFCCGLAVIDSETKCPRCKAQIEGRVPEGRCHHGYLPKRCLTPDCRHFVKADVVRGLR